ncbi:MAG: hypothetical protein F4Y25_13010 [Chloroflexi bacterium]|nr:hypothetical protein [Chloroflexota bacterium]
MNRKSIIANLAAILFSMVSVLAFAWFYGISGGLYVQIPVTLLTVCLLMMLFFREIRQRLELHKLQMVSLWISIPFTLLVAVLIDMYLERLISFMPDWMVLNIGFMFIMLFPAYIYYRIAAKEPFLVTAVALNIGFAWLWLALEILNAGIGVEFLLGPLLVAMLSGIPWIIALRCSWGCAKHTQDCHRMGPFMESLTMFLVAVPLVTLTILSVMAVTDGQHWIALAGIVVSFLFSSAVATPFRKWLRALGRLDEQQGD